jgi:hypothetical protein
MRAEILIVSYAPDAPWVVECLKSIKKFATGFAGVTVLVPLRDRDVFFPVIQSLPGTAILRTWADPEQPELRFMSHMVQKCFADFWCPRAQFVFHVDSDCMFTAPVTPEDYFRDGKPVLLCRRYSAGPPEILKWKAVVDFALRANVSWETMCGHPEVYTRETYMQTRIRVTKAHRKSFDAFVLGCKGSYPHGFCEFNTLGGMVMETPALREQYSIRCVDTEGWPPLKLKQFCVDGLVNGKHDVPENHLDEIQKILA